MFSLVHAMVHLGGVIPSCNTSEGARVFSSDHPDMDMRFAASVTDAFDVEVALDELIKPLDSRITRGMVDLVFLFVSGHFRDDFGEIVARMNRELPGSILLGCTVEGVLGQGREYERIPCMSLLAASLPDVQIHPFYINQEQASQATGTLDWERLVGVSPESKPVFVALADPFRFAVLDCLEKINEAYPGAPVIGGIASAARAPKENRLLVGDAIHDEGIVGVALSGKITVDTIVSQGCRPIGKSFVTTKADQNVIRELGGLPALKQLHEVLEELSAEDEQLARQSLFLGRVIDEYKGEFARGDFLIHNIIGADREKGALAIAGMARVGSTVQFHVRDAQSADEDLRVLLAPHATGQVRGALLFDCNGRGTNMWDQPDHDITAMGDLLGDVPIAGCFCGGEFGPVGGRNFVHGFTASIGLFRLPTDA